MTRLQTHTLDVPGAVLHYDVRSNDASAEPVLLLIGSPMGAAGFVTLAGHFTDRTVATYDPRGAGRSKRTDGALRSTTEEHADDLHRLIAAADADMAPPSHYAEIFELLDGGLRDGGWMGEGRPRGGHALAILPGLTHYNVFSSPLFAAVTLAFLDSEPS